MTDKSWLLLGFSRGHWEQKQMGERGAAEAAPRVKAMCTVVVQGSMLVGIDKMHVNVLGHA